MRLSILDQSIIRKGSTAADAIAETLATAQLAEQSGYYRFWVSEHHNSTMIAGSAPEILMVLLASKTATLRIGSGGIMLPNHSAYKVAENFRLLEVMFPGRIDLGMGRAPGGDRVSASLLNPSNTFSEESYLVQLEHLQAFFKDAASTGFGPVYASPQSSTIPEQWILSSSGGSSGIAAKFGMGLAIAKFINGRVDPSIVEQYRSAFQPGVMDKPCVLLAVQVLCAETEEKALELRKMSDFVMLQFEKGIFEPIRDFEEIRNYHFSATEQERIQHNRGRIISGTQAEVKELLSSLAKEFDIDEIMVSTMTFSPADRKRSFELLAEALISPARM